TAYTWSLQLVRRETSLALSLTSPRSSLTFGGAIHASARRPSRKRSARSSASRVSFFTRRLPQLLPRGWARWTLQPSSSSRSVAQYQPYEASRTTSGYSPAAVTARSNASRSSLSTWLTSRVSPSALRRTITLRRLCKSMPTYSWGFILVLLRRGEIGFATPSFSLGSPSRGWTLLLSTRRFGGTACPPAARHAGRSIPRSGHTGVVKRSFITSVERLGLEHRTSRTCGDPRDQGRPRA